jgi:hypothetical protein
MARLVESALKDATHECRLGPLPNCAWLLRIVTMLSLAALTWTYSPSVPVGCSLWRTGAGKSLSSSSKAWRVCARSNAASTVIMKDGAIGRGRGAMSPEQFQQAQDQIEKAKAATPKTPEQARRDSRSVGAGEIAPAQPTMQDESFLRTKAAHSVRGPLSAAKGAKAGGEARQSRVTSKQAAAAALQGKFFVPKSEMNAGELDLIRRRQEMARQVLYLLLHLLLLLYSLVYLLLLRFYLLPLLRCYQGTRRLQRRVCSTCPTGTKKRLARRWRPRPSTP